MTISYTTASVVKSRLGITDTASDTILANIIEAVSREIDNYCGRRFYAEAETNYYTAVTPTFVMTDDIVSVTSLLTDSGGDRTYATTWSTADYDMIPYNAANKDQPYTGIEVAENGDYEFPTIKKGVKITGSFGYCTTATQPGTITEACNLQAQRIFKRKDAPFGVMGSADMGTVMVIPKLDPDVKLMLDPYRRIV